MWQRTTSLIKSNLIMGTRILASSAVSSIFSLEALCFIACFARPDALLLVVDWIGGRTMNRGGFGYPHHRGVAAPNGGVGGSGVGHWAAVGGINYSVGNVSQSHPALSTNAIAVEASQYVQQQPYYQTSNYNIHNQFNNLYHAQQMTQLPAVDCLYSGGANVSNQPSFIPGGGEYGSVVPS